jgi:hypothetical protein
MARVPPGITQTQADARYNIAAGQSIDVTTHSTTLTTVESSSAVITFYGAMTGNLTFQLPSVSRVQRIANTTTGDYVLKVKRGSGGTAYAVIQGETMEIQ